MAFIVPVPTLSAQRNGAFARSALISQKGSLSRPAITSRGFFGSSQPFQHEAGATQARRFFVAAEAAAGASIVTSVPENAVSTVIPGPITVVPKPSTGVDMFNYAVEAGVKKSKMANWRVFVLSMMAGSFVAAAMALNLSLLGMLTAGTGALGYGLAKTISCAFFPFGLFLVLVYGAEMYTTNTMYMTASLLEKKTTVMDLVRSWSVSWLGNVAGCLCVAMLCKASGMFAPGPIAEAFAHATEAKALQPLGKMFFKGIMANWLVCTAAYGSLASKDMVSKAATIWLPVMTFIFLGTEHSVANMYTLPCGIFAGAHGVSWFHVFRNWIVASAGNALGGAVMVGVMTWLGHRALKAETVKKAEAK
eukprot:tig00000248_g21784.t1